MSDLVTRWTALAQRASRLTGVPTSTLLAITWNESRGQPGQVSSTGARGITQFEPETAKTYGVNTSPGHEFSQLLGTARYLNDLGYQHDPAGALAKYAGGPGNPQASYATAVFSRAQIYKGLDNGGKILSAPLQSGDPFSPIKGKSTGDVLGGAANTIASPFVAVGQATVSIGHFLADLTDPSVWLRVLEFVGGLLLGFFALKQLASAAGSKA